VKRLKEEGTCSKMMEPKAGKDKNQEAGVETFDL
jgi:hypothetical protein